jgi:hypothetical protein
MQKTAKEVMHAITSHNQKNHGNKPNTKCNQTQTAPAEVVHTAPKTTTNKKRANPQKKSIHSALPEPHTTPSNKEDNIHCRARYICLTSEKCGF